MCILIDANQAHSFRDPKCPNGRPVMDWVRAKHAKVVVGGKLSVELVKSGCGKVIEELARVGLTITLDGNRLMERTQLLVKQKALSSDDPHMIAAAQLSGARLLYSADNKLIADFKAKAHISNPRGKVYKTARNVDLLTPNHCAAAGCK